MPRWLFEQATEIMCAKLHCSRRTYFRWTTRAQRHAHAVEIFAERGGTVVKPKRWHRCEAFSIGSAEPEANPFGYQEKGKGKAELNRRPHPLRRAHFAALKRIPRETLEEYLDLLREGDRVALSVCEGMDEVLKRESRQ